MKNGREGGLLYYLVTERLKQREVTYETGFINPTLNMLILNKSESIKKCKGLERTSIDPRMCGN
jgi:hypothetical protein